MQKVVFILRFLGNALIFIGLIILIFTYTPIIVSEIGYRTHSKWLGGRPVQVREVPQGPVSENIEPFQTNENFAIIISKIGVNAPIVPNVTTVNKTEYMESLRYGVAHAKGTALPGDPGNSFLFAHSSLNFWQLGPYATVFNMLKKLDTGDTIILLHDGKPFLYRVFSKEVAPGWDTKPFDVEYPEPVVTLVTCDPPGSTRNRLIVKASLVTE